MSGPSSLRYHITSHRRDRLFSYCGLKRGRVGDGGDEIAVGWVQSCAGVADKLVNIGTSESGIELAGREERYIRQLILT
jgi:hypothetical protein